MTTTTHPAQADRTTCHGPEWCGQYSNVHPTTRSFCSKECLDRYALSRSSPPPIAPPAPAPAERRAGQRWRLETNGRSREFGLVSPFGDMGSWLTDDGLNAGGYVWSDPAYVMTLVSDAPATSEPGRACACGAKEAETHRPGCKVRCGKCGSPGPAHTCSWPATPAQEAAKAPVTIACAKGCGRSKMNDAQAMTWTCDKCQAEPRPGLGCENALCFGTDVDVVTFDAREHTWCASCWSYAIAWMKAQPGSSCLHNDEHPERLPRPRLAHSSQWPDECEDIR